MDGPDPAAAAAAARALPLLLAGRVGEAVDLRPAPLTALVAVLSPPPAAAFLVAARRFVAAGAAGSAAASAGAAGSAAAGRARFFAPWLLPLFRLGAPAGAGASLAGASSASKNCSSSSGTAAMPGAGAAPGTAAAAAPRLPPADVRARLLTVCVTVASTSTTSMAASVETAVLPPRPPLCPRQPHHHQSW